MRLGALTGAGGGARSAPVSPRLIRLAEVLLVIAIGAVLASIFWTAAGPVPRPSAAPRQSVVAAEPTQAGPIDPFATAGGATAELPADFNASPDVAETSLNLTLHGTWIDDKGGAAIIKTPDEKQGRYGPGDTVTSGVTLERVYADRVIINRGGVRESLRLINRDKAPSAAPAGRQAAAPADIAEFDAEEIGAIGHFITATPQVDAVGNTRLVLQPAGDPEAFQKLGLRPGDMIVAIDNQEVADDFAAGLDAIASLEGRQSVTISVERDGVVMPVRIALPNTVSMPND